MAIATLDGVVVAESADTVLVEGNHYFPPSSVKLECFTEVAKTTGCPWKGTANYCDVAVEGAQAPAAAWVYHDPKKAAANLKNHMAFWGQVVVSD
ncbi:MAG: DUF427 domain-containing protein [Acidimicrobiia bacterium]|nr:DUF427 domain-containing protein [Acidimicrobiia bacterium]